MDLQTFMNAGVSLQGEDGGSSGHPNVDRLTIERVMDWIEARLEALKEEDDSEDDGTDKDQRGKAPARGSGNTPASQRQRPPAASSSTPSRMLPPSRTSEGKRNGRRSPDHDRDDHQSRHQNSAPTAVPPSSRHSSPSSPQSISPTISSRPVISRKERERHAFPGGILQNLQHYPFDFAIPITPSSRNIPQGLGLVTDPPLTAPLPITIINTDGSTTPSPAAIPTAGSKRRHASMTSADAAPPNGTPARLGTHTHTQNTVSRRRNRSGRLSTGPGSIRSNDAGGGAGVGGMLAYEPMEVEGGARKVPRR